MQSDLVKRFITFYDMIDQFGLGMVIFPGIVSKMSGSTSAKYLPQMSQIGDNKSSPSELTKKPESLKISFTVPM